MVRKLLALILVILLLSLSLVSCKDKDDSEVGDEPTRGESGGNGGTTDLPIDEFD